LQVVVAEIKTITKFVLIMTLTPGRHQQSKQQQQASQSPRVASLRAEAEAGLVSILIPIILAAGAGDQE
jgi:hypothetical protein